MELFSIRIQRTFQLVSTVGDISRADDLFRYAWPVTRRSTKRNDDRDEKSKSYGRAKVLPVD